MALDWRKIVGLTGPYEDTTGLGPDFPGSAGDRERAKFRESAHPRLTQVAVTGDDGEPVSKSTNDLLEEVIYELRTMRHALVLGGLAEDIDEPIK